MKVRAAGLVPVIGIVLCIGLGAPFAFAQDLPLVKGKRIVASVNGEQIALDELAREIAVLKKEGTPGAKVDRKVELDVLQRLINTRLIVQEARNIGLDKLPENKMMVDAYAKEALREELAEKVMGDAKVDEKAVEKIYKEAVREWKVSAVLCDKEDDAKRFEAELKAGKSFGELAKAFKANGRAKQIEATISSALSTCSRLSRPLRGMSVSGSSTFWYAVSTASRL